ncbi:MAG: hypothetical protein ACTMIV_13140, partial [Brevibacterium aurantiacum]
HWIRDVPISVIDDLCHRIAVDLIAGRHLDTVGVDSPWHKQKADSFPAAPQRNSAIGCLPDFVDVRKRLFAVEGVVEGRRLVRG